MLEIYDTTLRDGSQGEGVNLSLADKLALTTALDWAGMAFIEGGWARLESKRRSVLRRSPLAEADARQDHRLRLDPARQECPRG